MLLRQEVSGGLDKQEFTELSLGHRASIINDTVTAPIEAQHVTQIAESGLHIKHGAVAIHFSHSSAVNGPALPVVE